MTSLPVSSLSKLSKDNWIPNERGQKSALQVPYSVFEMLYGGALGGGKSELGLAIPIVRRTKDDKCQLYEHPFFRGIIFRRTFPQLEKSLIPRAKYWYRDILGAVYRDQKHSFEFPSGAVVYLAHMEREDDVKKYDTDEYHYVFIDQAEEFSESQLRYISSRIRTRIPELPTLYYLSANPGGLSHTYLRDRFVKPYPSGNVIIKDKATSLKRIYIPAKLSDNPHIYETDPEYINRLQLLPEKERKAKIDGDWFTFAGRVFTELRANKVPGEPENAIHVVTPFRIPEYWPRILAIDWGYDAQTFAIWAAISPEHRIYIYRTYAVRKTNISSWASDIARLSQYENINRVVLDPSGWANRGDELTIEQQFTKWSGFRPRRADNDRQGGRQLIHDLLRWEKKPPKFVPEAGLNIDTANEIFRRQGLDAYNSYLNSFNPEPEELNIPRLVFFGNGICQELLDCLDSCQYAERDGKVIEDVKEFVGDDPYDCLRYLVKETDHFIVELRREVKFREQQGTIMTQFDKDKDYNSMYMRMQNLEESQINSDPKPVSLYD